MGTAAWAVTALGPLLSLWCLAVGWRATVLSYSHHWLAARLTSSCRCHRDGNCNGADDFSFSQRKQLGGEDFTVQYYKLTLSTRPWCRWGWSRRTQATFMIACSAAKAALCWSGISTYASWCGTESVLLLSDEAWFLSQYCAALKEISAYSSISSGKFVLAWWQDVTLS